MAFQTRAAPPASTVTPPNCYCGAPMKLRMGRRYRPFWGCTRWPHCDGAVGTHKGTDIPLGKAADKLTREARMRAHEAFDKVWKSGLMKRRKAYLDLAAHMGLDPDDCHIGNFDTTQCEAVIAWVEELGSGAA